MKRQIDLEKAAEAEAFGALALTANQKHRKTNDSGQPFTLSQNRALADLAHSLLEAARKAGAVQGRVTVGDVSLELQENGNEEILSIRTAAHAVR